MEIIAFLAILPGRDEAIATLVSILLPAGLAIAGALVAASLRTAAFNKARKRQHLAGNRLAGLEVRSLALLVDFCIFIGVTLLANFLWTGTVAVGTTPMDRFAVILVLLPVFAICPAFVLAIFLREFLISWLLYRAVSETLTRGSIGHHIVGLQVLPATPHHIQAGRAISKSRRARAHKVSLGAAIARNLFLLVDTAGFGIALGISVLVSLVSKQDRKVLRWGDRFAKTMVVDRYAEERERSVRKRSQRRRPKRSRGGSHSYGPPYAPPSHLGGEGGSLFGSEGGGESDSFCGGDGVSESGGDGGGGDF